VTTVLIETHAGKSFKHYIKNSMSGFKEKVHEVVKAIPAGQTLSYKEVANMAGSPKGYRAVANLMARNYNQDIPCHRVVRSDGALGGYNRGGEVVKKAKLVAEGVKF